MSIMDLIEKAFIFAYEKHATQRRKSRGCPYIVHVMDVASTLMKEKASPNLVAAGFLHDVVEDNEHTGVTESDLRREFGDAIANLVMQVTEPDRSLSWKERKQLALDRLKGASREVLLLKCADKLANLTDTLAEYSVKGDEVWKVFKSDKEQQLWYYKASLERLAPVSDTICYKELKNKVELLERVVKVVK